MEIERLVIKRSEWYRGRGPNNSQLVCMNGEKCCLGFLGVECGIDLAHLLTATPIGTILGGRDAVRGEWPDGIFTLGGANSAWTSQAMSINDDDRMGDGLREERLIEHFALISIELSFVD